MSSLSTHPSLFALVVILVLMQGCVTPIEIKNASKSQLELIDTVDQAVKDLQSSIDQLHRNQEELIREEGRMLIARQAVDFSTSDGRQVNADQLYEIFIEKIQPSIDFAFEAKTVEQALEDLQKRIDSAPNTIVKLTFEGQLEKLREIEAALTSRPAEVKELEVGFAEDIIREQETAVAVAENLKILRAQIALMKAMHSRVDSWLAIDVTVTQEQIDSLKDAFSKAKQSMALVGP